MAKKSETPPKKSKKTVKSRVEKVIAAKVAETKTAARQTVDKKTEKKAKSTVKTVKKPVKASVTPASKSARRKPHATRPTKAEQAKILERQNLVMDLKTNGASFRRIEKHLKSLGHDVSLGTVHADYVASLERLQTMNIDKTEYHLTQELEKLEDWEFDLNALKSRPLSVYEVVAIKGMLVTLQNQRDKFLVISKGKKAEINAQSALAKLLGVAPEELPDDGAASN